MHSLPDHFPGLDEAEALFLLLRHRPHHTLIRGQPETQHEKHRRLHLPCIGDPVDGGQVRRDVIQVIGYPRDLREPFLGASFGASTAPAMILLAASITAFRSSSVRSSKSISAP